MKFLLTNDDGIYAPGLLALKRELVPLGEVYIVAPDRPRSATGHSITLHKPLRVAKIALADGSLAWASNGTPSDCVVLGLSGELGWKPDMVVSGINVGSNLGEDITYSGTVSAAMEGAICGLPSFAISLAGEPIVDMEAAARFAARLAQVLAEQELPAGTFLNVNVPAVAEAEIAGVEITRQARRRYKERLEKRIDLRGQEYYWLGGELMNEGTLAGTDVEAVQHNKISITPIHLDLTQYDFIEKMKHWKL